MSDKTLIVDQGVVAGNVYDKYATRNPIARYLMDGFLASFRELVRRSGAAEAHEVGCGEGGLSVELARLGLRVRASDFSSKIIEIARQTVTEADAVSAVDLEIASVYDLEPERHAAPLVVCCEVLEHLEEPERALDVLARLARPHVLVSVPREPLWRVLNMARGRYLKDLGNTPGHLNWWSKRRFLEFVSSRFEIVEVRSPLPWTMVLGRRRDDEQV